MTVPARALVFSGHRIDAPGTATPRFPAASEPLARALIREAVAAEIARPGPPLVGVAGAASGGDILFHEVCDELGAPTQVHLAKPPADYVESSVAEAGPEWIARFAAVTGSRPVHVLAQDGDSGSSVWQRSNHEMLQAAAKRAGRNVALIALWNGATGRRGGGTGDMVRRARALGARVVVLDATRLSNANERRSRAWRGRELFESNAWRHELSPAHVGDLRELVERTRGREPESFDPPDAVLPAFEDLSSRLSAALEDGPGAVLLRRLPLEEWDPSAIERAYWALALQLGTPVSQNAEGRRLFPVRDAGYSENDPRFRGPMSRKRLSFHTDRCDVIAFLCIQPAAQGGATFVVSSLALHDELRRRDPATLDVLSRPFPYLRHTVDLGNERPYCELPVFSERDGRFAAHFLRVLIDRADRSAEAPSLTAEQHAALDTLEELAEDPALHVSLNLAPGDVLLLNNWTTLHRRSEFVDSPDPERKRHLLRIWLSTPNSRPIDPRFADHFGATEAGALRGGMRALSRGA